MKSLFLTGTFLSSRANPQIELCAPAVLWASSNMATSKCMFAFRHASDKTWLDWYVENKTEVVFPAALRHSDTTSTFVVTGTSISYRCSTGESFPRSTDVSLHKQR